MSFNNKINDAVAKSVVGRWFKLRGSGVEKERDTDFITELRAGATTYVTMAYIIAVNALVVSQSGGPCRGVGDKKGWPSQAEYMDCVELVRRDLVVATAVICTISTIMMGLFANLPIALAPGLGGSAYFTFTVVGFMGSKSVTFETALAAIFIEGIIFMVMSILGIRQWLARHIPPSIKVASGAGIGLFLTHIGLQYSAGIGLIAHSPATLVDLGGCPRSALTPSGECQGQQMMSPTLWMGILGFFMIVILMQFKVKGAILIGVLSVGALSWFRGTSITYFPDTPKGNASFAYFSKIVDFHPITKTLGAFNFDLRSAEVWSAVIIFLFVDLLDTTATLYSMARFGKFLDEFGDFEGSYAAFIIDAFSISVGALFGNPPNTAYIESGAGIAEGGRTGLTAVTSGILFFLSIFFAPVFASLPPWSSGAALITVGSLMMASIVEINWTYLGDSVPAFLTIALMPLTYSIAYGLIAGIGSYIAINCIIWAIDSLLGLFGEKAAKYKSDQTLREPWRMEDDGTFFIPGWFVRKYMPKAHEKKMRIRSAALAEMQAKKALIHKAEFGDSNSSLDSTMGTAVHTVDDIEVQKPGSNA